MQRQTISITGMSCTGCEQRVETALQNLDGVSQVDADHEANTVELVMAGDASDGDVRRALEATGYDVVA